MKIIEDAQLEVKRKLPWIIDIFLYPLSASGVIHLAVFIFLPLLFSFLVGLLGRLLAPHLREGTSYILTYLVVPFYIVFYSYLLYYIAYCILDSTRGNRRAPDTAISDNFDAGDLVSQVILLLGCIAICLWPPAVYYLFNRQTGLWFWLLSACGVFFLPMSFLRGVMFDSFDTLNPMRIIQSICNTLVPYCGLVLFFFAVGGFIQLMSRQSPLPSIFSKAIVIYLVLVLAHRLGWFYWWHKDRLKWGL